VISDDDIRRFLEGDMAHRILTLKTWGVPDAKAKVAWILSQWVEEALKEDVSTSTTFNCAECGAISGPHHSCRCRQNVAPSEVSVNIARVEVTSEDPDRFVHDLVQAHEKCALQEGNCKAGDCPEHGIFPKKRKGKK